MFWKEEKSILKFKESIRLSKRFLINFAKRCFFELPFGMLFVIGIGYAYQIIFEPYSELQYQILFGSIGVTATISGLSFRAASLEPDEKRKYVFRFSGERLFHAVILFTMATATKYMLIKTSSELSRIQVMRETVLSFKILFLIYTIAFFNYGIMYLKVSLQLLHVTLFKDNEKPFD